MNPSTLPDRQVGHHICSWLRQLLVDPRHHELHLPTHDLQGHVHLGLLQESEGPSHLLGISPVDSNIFGAVMVVQDRIAIIKQM